MKLHVFQHEPCEQPAHLAEWARLRGFEISTTHWYLGETPPDMRDIDWLAVLGGPMNIYQHRDHPWLVGEKQKIREAVDLGKKIVGICLGAQLLADLLGGKVYQNPHREIGWFPVRWLEPARLLLPGLPTQTTVLHWHGDTFDLPPGAVHLAESEACPNQAFVIGKQILAFQFHIEVTPDSIWALTEMDRAGLTPDTWVQDETTIQSGNSHTGSNQRLLESWLDWLAM